MDLNEFENLEPEQQAKVFHQTSFKEKGDLLLHSHDPLALTRSLSQEELYLVAKEMDLEERSEVIRYASLPQLFFIADIDCWKKDRIDPRSFVHWLETLIQADEKLLLGWLVQTDYENLVSSFKKVIEVMKPDREWAADEILGDTPYFTLDENYFIMVNEENMGTVRRAIEILFENKRGIYAALMEGVLAELEDELEEEAYQRREIRLTERGFPDFETARKLYRPLTRQEFDSYPKKDLKAADPVHELKHVPNYPVLWSEERFFLDDALELFREDPAALEKLQEELAWLSNKVIAADGIDFSSEEKVRRGIERARSFISIGLELLAERDLVRAREILKTSWLELIFRWGATRIVLLREDSLKIAHDYWKSSKENFLDFLDLPYNSIFQGLFRLVPEYYDPMLKEFDGLRDFKSLEEIERAKLSVRQMTRIHQVLHKHLPDFFEKEAQYAVKTETELTLFSLAGTLFAGFVLKGKISFNPLDAADIKKFMAKAFTDGLRRTLQPEIKKAFTDKMVVKEDESAFRSFWPLLFDRIEEEFAALKSVDNLDPRYVSVVHMKPGKEAPSKKARKAKK